MIRHTSGSTATAVTIKDVAAALRRATGVAVLFGRQCTADPVDLMLLADALDAPLIYAFDRLHATPKSVCRGFESVPAAGGWASVTVAAAEGRFLLSLGVEGAYGRLQRLSKSFALIGPEKRQVLGSESSGICIQCNVVVAVTHLLQDIVGPRINLQATRIMPQRHRAVAGDAPLVTVP